MSYRATSGNDYWIVPRYGDPSNTLIDGLGGTDVLGFDRLPLSRFHITQDPSTGIVSVDSVSGASSTYHLKLINVEYLSFNYGRDNIDLTTYFGDSIPPTISGMNPADGAEGVAINTRIQINFSESVTRGSGTIVLQTADGTPVETFDAASSSHIVFVANRLTIYPTEQLNNLTTYTVQVAAGAVKDLSGNALGSDGNFHFTTVANAPPLADAGSAVVSEDVPLQGTLPAAHDPEGQPLTYALASEPGHGQVTINEDGSFTYTPEANYWGEDSFSYTASDGQLDSEPASMTITVTPVVDTIKGGNGNDVLTGNSDADILIGGAGNDAIDGGGGLDIAGFSAALGSYQITRSGNQLTVTDTRVTAQTDGTDTLVNVERLNFSDQSLAFDLDGAAGTTAKVLGAVFGADAVSNKTYAGIGLHLFDQGMSYEQVMNLALNARLGAGAANQDVVNLLYTNVVGHAPDASTSAYYVSLLDNGTLSSAQLGVLAADYSLNASNIDLVGLADTGLGYIPL